MSDSLLSADLKITLLFVALGGAGWYVASSMDAGQGVQFAVLLGVGVLVPTLINEWRDRKQEA